ncbi:MAG: putative porin [Cyclobacteriaceae bacterium]|nr:putative porin [Cyclobacteriaceae bacterium]
MVISHAVLGQEEEERPRVGSRIIDDTTRQIYGPTTSRFFTLDEIFYNRWQTYPIDTVIQDFHRFGYVERYENKYQDLGNIGTAITPIYNSPPEKIGALSGFNAYDLYWDTQEPAYYNTRSPYSNMHVMLGGRGRSLTHVTYSRNINPRLNFGFSFNGLFIDKQVQRQGKGDRNVTSNNYTIFLSYHSKDSSYVLLANFRRMYHRVFEYGGVKLEGDYVVEDLFKINAQPWLENAESNDLRRNYYLYHQYKTGNGFQLYHRFDSHRQRNQFLDGAEPNGSVFFDAVVVDSATTKDEVKFNTLRNELGVKGNLLKFFYNGFVVFRNFAINYKYFYEDDLYLPTTGTEFYVGGRMRLDLKSWLKVTGNVEWMLDDRHRINGAIQSRWFEASVERSVYTPAFLQQAYRGSHDVWLNNFSNSEASRIKGNLIVKSRRLVFYPGVSLSTFRNLIFFKKGDYGSDQTVLPVQTEGYQTLVNPELRLSVMVVKNLSFNVTGIYTEVLENAGDAIQVPRFFVNSQLAYSNIWFGGNFDFQVGADVHWKSAYYAYGYDPAIQQFYQQQVVKAPDFPVINVFLNAKVLRGRIFLRYHNLFKAFSNTGPVPTPGYPGVRNVLDFGFDWSFYD